MSTHEANGSARITATCFAPGEAAGVAASLAVALELFPADLGIGRSQAELRECGVVLDVGDTVT